jgi:hypothetical protein
MTEIRFRDIDPDSGNISQDKRICLIEDDRMVDWVMYGLSLVSAEEDDPNREIYKQEFYAK